ncbi:MAG: 3-deoxy-manno-octulosonate cytidylyltransferase [Alphaproteobacteria bacterium]|nr:3-deoxy-manno-octulosonate cytidylyltransferase [Alphaproteobacteria bacterium]
MNPIVVIPARMASTRLPGKPLADIHGAPMIVQVWRRAMEAAVGPVLVACAEREIADAVERAGGEAVLTRPDHPSGSDRVFEAVQAHDPDGRFDVVVNVQGDLPTLDPAVIRAALSPVARPEVDIATLVARIGAPGEATDPNVVKAVVAFPSGEGVAFPSGEGVAFPSGEGVAFPSGEGAVAVGRALYFSRATVPAGDGPLFHHIGLYAYRREALGRFVALPPGVLELRERLEQLRALENGMRIDAALVDTVPLGVDTPADLERARALLAPHLRTPS